MSSSKWSLSCFLQLAYIAEAYGHEALTLMLSYIGGNSVLVVLWMSNYGLLEEWFLVESFINLAPIWSLCRKNTLVKVRGRWWLWLNINEQVLSEVAVILFCNKLSVVHEHRRAHNSSVKTQKKEMWSSWWCWTQWTWTGLCESVWSGRWASPCLNLSLCTNVVITKTDNNAESDSTQEPQLG